MRIKAMLMSGLVALGMVSVTVAGSPAQAHGHHHVKSTYSTTTSIRNNISAVNASDDVLHVTVRVSADGHPGADVHGRAKLVFKPVGTTTYQVLRTVTVPANGVVTIPGLYVGGLGKGTFKVNYLGHVATHHCHGTANSSSVRFFFNG